MREIKFRGKRIDNGEWVQGFLRWPYPDDYPPEITFWTDDCGGYYATVAVDPATVGQYTGLKDKNGKEIYEGDIVENKYIRGVVKFGNPDFKEGSLTSMFYIEVIEVLNYGIFTFKCDVWTEFNDVKVIGNIHDNPELLGGITND